MPSFARFAICCQVPSWRYWLIPCQHCHGNYTPDAAADDDIKVEEMGYTESCPFQQSPCDEMCYHI